MSRLGRAIRNIYQGSSWNLRVMYPSFLRLLRSAPWPGAFFFTKRASLRLFADRQREYMVESSGRSGKNERGPQPNPPSSRATTVYRSAIELGRCFRLIKRVVQRLLPRLSRRPPRVRPALACQEPPAHGLDPIQDSVADLHVWQAVWLVAIAFERPRVLLELA